MIFENKLGITDAAELFGSGYLDSLEAGTFKSLAEIHRYLFEDVYEFAGKGTGAAQESGLTLY